MLIFKFGQKAKLVNYLFWTIIDSFQAVFVAYILGQFISAATKGSMQIFLENTVLAGGGFLIFLGVSLLQANAETSFVASANLEIKQVMFQHILREPAANTSISDNISFMTNDLKLLETNGIKTEMNMITNLFTFIFALVASVTYDIWTTIAFFIGSLVPIVISQFTQGTINKKGAEWSATNSKFTAHLKDVLTGKQSIRVYHAEKVMNSQLIKFATKLEDALRKMNLTIGVVNSFAYTVAMVTAMTIPFGVGVYRIIGGALTIASFIAVMQLSNSVTNPLMSIVTANNERQTVTEIQTKVLAAKEEFVNEEGAFTDGEPVKFDSLRLADVSIKMNDHPLFEHLDLNVQAGDKILIMAPSGFGKSTLLHILDEDLKPSSGTYYYNDQPSSTYSTGTLRQQFAWIDQTPFAFDSTVKFNMTLGLEFGNDKIKAALTDAGLSQFATDEGLNYKVGENGHNLSGGELQRLEIARARLFNRPILLADEATSSLDEKTAKQIHELFMNDDQTLIEVAHHVPEDEFKDYTQVIRLDEATA